MMNLHKTPDTLPIYNYQQIVNGNGLKWLYCFDYKNGEQPPETLLHAEKELSEIWENIQSKLPESGSQNKEVELYRDLAVATWMYSFFKHKKDDRRMYYNFNLAKKLTKDLNELLQDKDKKEEEKFDCIEMIILINSKLNISLNHFTTDTTTFWKSYNIYNDLTEAEKKQYDKMKAKK